MPSFPGGSPARDVNGTRQPLHDDEDEPLLCCDVEIPQHIKEDLDVLPGTSRRCKLQCCVCFSCLVFIGIAVGVIFLESITKTRVDHDEMPKARQAWLNAGGEGLPPGYCEEHAMPVPDVTEEGWAREIVKKMTEEEKYRLIHGVGFAGFKLLRGFYVGSVLGVPRLGIPSIKMQDGGAGFRTSSKEMIGSVTSWPCPLVAAASWDPQLVEALATAMGKEFRVKGANMILGPALNLHRTPYGGRNAEYLSGEDPVLGSVLGKAFVKGAQEGAGVATAVKHFALNDQETERTISNSIASERLRWEKLYAPFQSAIDQGTAAVMCSYNYVDGKQACSNKELLKNDLRKRMGHKNFVVSDWWAIRDDEAADAGTNINMPGDDQRYAKTKLGKSLHDGRLDELVEEVLRGMGSSGAWSDLPGDDCRVGCNCEAALYGTTATSPAHLELAKQVAAAGAVLLKNEPVGHKRVLPLSTSQRIAVVGEACDLKDDLSEEVQIWTAASYYSMGGTSRVLSTDDVTVLEGLRRHAPNLAASVTDLSTFAREAMKGADVAVLCAGATSTESVDRPSLRLDQEDFVEEVLRLGKELQVPVVTVLLVPGAVVMPWSQDASGILMMFPSGQTTGLAAADLLFGVTSRSGKLPLTIPREEKDALKPCKERDCPYQEELFSGWLLYTGRDVLFPFGFGLSYTGFEYKAVKAPETLESSAVIRLTVKNVGERPGREVVQLYMRFPIDHDTNEEPATQLRSFHRTKELQPGEVEEVVLRLSARDMSVWDSKASEWKEVYGAYSVGVGASSRDLRLCGTFRKKESSPPTTVWLEKCPQEKELLAAKY